MGKFNLYDDLMAGLDDVIAYKKGDKTRCHVQVRAIVKPNYHGVQVQRLRKKLNLSQTAMATAMNISPRTVEAWESGINKPHGTAQTLLYLFDKNPDLVETLVSKE